MTISESESHSLHVHPIGVIRTPFNDKYSAPRQPADEGIVARGRVVLERGYNFEQALEDIDGFEKIWLIYWFDRNANWKPKVLPPRGSKTKRGVFATRAPHRPNPIGLSLVTLIEVKGRNLIVEGVDMLDKTPLLDIKPYLPEFESFPNAATGWVSIQGSELTKQFEYSDKAIADLGALEALEQQEIRRHIEHLLRYDIETHPYKRIVNNGDGNYVLAYKYWRIIFTAPDEFLVRVESIQKAEISKIAKI